jgi:hypothetical protein
VKGGGRWDHLGQLLVDWLKKLDGHIWRRTPNGEVDGAGSCRAGQRGEAGRPDSKGKGEGEGTGAGATVSWSSQLGTRPTERATARAAIAPRCLARGAAELGDGNGKGVGPRFLRGLERSDLGWTTWAQ